MRLRSIIGALLLQAGVLLPYSIANATIINIDATVSGADSINFDPTLSVSGAENPVQLLLGAGTYTFRIVTPGSAPGATYTAWSRCCSGAYNSTAYVVYSDSDTSTPLMIGGEYLGADTADDAYATTVADNLDTATLTLLTTQTLDFVIPDLGLDDNVGGVSVLISLVDNSNPIPEPASGLLLVAGAGMLLRLRRRMVG